MLVAIGTEFHSKTEALELEFKRLMEAGGGRCSAKHASVWRPWCQARDGQYGVAEFGVTAERPIVAPVDDECPF